MISRSIPRRTALSRGPSVCAAIAAAACLVVLGACGERDASDPPSRAVSTEVSSGPVRIRASLDRDSITVPEEVVLTVETEIEVGTVARLGVAELSWGDTLGDFTILSHRVSAPVLDDAGRVRTVRWLVLEPFLPGEHIVPGLDVEYRGVEGQAARARTEPMVVRVESVLEPGETLEVDEPRKLASLPKPEPFPWGLLVGAVGTTVGLIVAGLGFLWWRQARHRDRSVFDDACPRVAELTRRIPGQEHECRAVWDECGRLLTACLAERLEPDAERLTGHEIADRARDWFGLPDPDRDRLRVLLGKMELVRFGGAPASPESTSSMVHELEDLLDRIRDASDMVVVEPGRIRA